MAVPDFCFYGKSNHKKLDFSNNLVNNMPRTTPLEVAHNRNKNIKRIKNVY